jgi:hypothetical protein
MPRCFACDTCAADVNYAETLSTLQFAQRAKRVQCKAVRNCGIYLR